MEKKPWQSKTLVINGVIGLAAFVSLFIPGAAGTAPWIQAHAGEIGTVWAIGNIVLRLITKDKITLGE